ncbi:MAG: response regulator [FCB group bacterium]|nr:response regulator [FCB group bacterium]MBL7028713.1 response regulator [Candidatus Neomarinimicrobiota bacterium]MBL7120683.1 response regulator [Candidatus Neomarinimicrobiota bacterium]
MPQQIQGFKSASKPVVWVTFLMLAIPYLRGDSDLNTADFDLNSDLKFTTYSAEDGLPGMSMTAVMQDSKGFIWVGSSDGLFRYDGYNFKPYSNIPGDSTSLSHNAIWEIMEDHSGILWIGTEEGGVNAFNPATEVFTRYTHDPNDNTSLSDGYIMNIVEDSDHTIWVGTTKGGLNRLNKETGRFDRFTHNPEDSTSISGNYIGAIYEDMNHNLWIGTRGGHGINLFDRETDTFTELVLDPSGEVETPPAFVTGILEDKPGHFLISSLGRGMYKMIPDYQGNTITIRYEHIPLSQEIEGTASIFRVIKGPSGNFWISTWGAGILKFNPVDHTFIQYTIGPESGTLSNIFVFDIAIDRSGTLWAATDDGLNKADLRRKQFWRYEIDPELMLQEDVHKIIEGQDGTIWLASGSLGRIKGGIVPGEEPEIIVYLNDPKDKHSLPEGTVQTIFEDSKGSIWLGMRLGGLARFDPQTNQFTSFKRDPEDSTSLSHDIVASIYEDRWGTLWIGTLGLGIDRLDSWDKSGNASFSHFKFHVDESLDEDNLRIWTMLEDQEGLLWIGTRGGLIHYDQINNIVLENFRFDENDPNSLGDSNVNHLYLDTSGNLWLSTFSGGLNKYLPAEKKFRRYKMEDGLSSNLVGGVFEDDLGYLWVPTNKGFCRFDPETETFRQYYNTDGIGTQNFTTGVHSTSGLIYMGGSQGITLFDPAKIQDNPIPPQLELTNFLLFNESVSIRSDDSPLPRNIAYVDTLTLSHRENVFSFEFAALHHSNPEHHSYAYQLEGFDEDWFYVGDKREITFTNLDPGDYVFKVKGSNSDGLWGDRERSLTLIIDPPWWKTWWAYLIYLSSALLLLAFIRRYELNRQQYKRRLELEQIEAQKLLEIDALKSRFFTNISHEFRTPLTIILGQLDILMEKSRDADLKQKLGVAHNNGKRLLQLINQLLDLSKLEAKRMRLKVSRNDLIPLTNNLLSSFQSLAQQRGLALEFSSDTPNLEMYFEPELLERVFLNLISNAIKFTPSDGQIKVVIQSQEPALVAKNTVSISVIDTGVGIPQDRVAQIFDRFYQVDDTQTREYEGTGIGLALVKELVELHHGSVHLTSEEEVGTTFKVLLPTDEQQFSVSEISNENDTVAISGPLPVEYDIPVAKEEPDAKDSERQEVVLLVEDNQDIRQYIKEVLEDQYQIVQASDGVEGIQVANETIPDLIITDVMMPRMDGNTFVKRIRSDERSSHVPIIMLTARAEAEDKIGGLELGVDDYLTKPFNPRELRVRVQNLLDMRAKLRKRFSGALVIKPEEVSTIPADKKFMQRLIVEIESHIADEQFSTETLSRTMGVSSRTLSRKLNALIDQSPAHLIRSMRLQRAAELLEKQTGNIAEIAYEVGFSDQAHFTRTFKNEFKVSPSEYMKSKQQSD